MAFETPAGPQLKLQQQDACVAVDLGTAKRVLAAHQPVCRHHGQQAVVQRDQLR